MSLTPEPPPIPRAFIDAPLNSLIEAAFEAIVVVDEQQLIVAINPAALQMFRCTSVQAIGHALDRFVPPAARASHADLIRRLADAAATPRYLIERRQITALRADGQEFPLQLVVSRIDVVGVAESLSRRRYYAAFMRDLSEHAALQGDLQRSKDRLRAALELAPIGIWIAEHDQVVFANRAAARLFGAEDGESLLGRSIYSLLQADVHTVLSEQVKRVLDHQGDVASVHGRLAGGEGGAREVDITLAALPDHGCTTVQMVVADVTQRRLEAFELERSRQALRRLSASLVEAREEERQRIARELHDELGQRLTALKMDLSSFAPGDDARVMRMQAMLDETVASVRRIAADLRPLMLDDLGLNAAVEWLANDASKRLGIGINLQLAPLDSAVDQRVAIAAYRIVQEALTNVARHARATEVDIALHLQDDELVLTVQDNGVGLPARATPNDGRLGLMGIRERAEMLGGRLDLGNVPEGGACLRVRLPRQPPPAAGRDSAAAPGVAPGHV